MSKTITLDMPSEHVCSDVDITDIGEYLECSKVKFEHRLEHEQHTREALFEDFILHKTIGIGAFGRVLLVNHKSDAKKFLAMKILKKEQVIRRNYLRHVLNEKQILASVRHPFMIHLEYYAKDLCNLYIVMPFVLGGDIFGLIRDRGALGEVSTRFYSGQLVLALEYLHTMDIIYRDLKPENILIDASGYVKLTDFGLSKRISKPTTTLCGTPQYLAPEIISIKAYGKPIDWWALGVILYELVSGMIPFNAENDRKLYNKILNGHYKVPSSFSPDLKDLVKHLLQVDVTKRYGNLKNGVSDIKLHRWYKSIDWLLLFNKGMEAPFVPHYISPSDTRNFEYYSDEDTTTICNEVDQSYFDNF